MGQYERIMGERMKRYPILEWHEALEEVNYINSKCGLRREGDWALVAGLGLARQITFGQLKTLFLKQARAAYAGKGTGAIIAILSHVIGVKLPGSSDDRGVAERSPRLGEESFANFTLRFKPDRAAADLPEAAVELARNEGIATAGQECLEAAIATVEPAEATKLGLKIGQWPLRF